MPDQNTTRPDTLRRKELREPGVRGASYGFMTRLETLSVTRKQEKIETCKRFVRPHKPMDPPIKAQSTAPLRHYRQSLIRLPDRARITGTSEAEID
jgi:hypothetical protein